MDNSGKRILIIGGGPGGYIAALHAARKGAKPLIIEKRDMGGTCLNRGCIPTKSLIACATVFEKTQKAAEFGVKTGTVEADFGIMMQRKEKMVNQLCGGLGMLFKSWGVETLKGTAKFKDKNTLAVTGQDGASELKSDRIIIATGSEPSAIPGLAIDGKFVLNSDHALEMSELPESILIVGGGAIGLEFASIYSALGVKVTLIEMLADIAPTEDRELSLTLKRIMGRKVAIKVETRLEKAEIAGAGVKATITGPGGAEEITVDRVLVAAGRKPYTEGLGLKEIGIQTEKGFISVNDKMETGVEGVYAIGDVTGGILLAHVASEEGIVAVDNALGKAGSIDYSIIPNCIYCTPQLASVGLSEERAKAEGLDYASGKFPFTACAKGLVSGNRDGFIKIISDKATGKILGVHILGHEATELIAEAAMAIKTGAVKGSFTRIMHAHPTLHEAMLEAVDDISDMATGLGKKKK